jgi:hypothetical protein
VEAINSCEWTARDEALMNSVSKRLDGFCHGAVVMTVDDRALAELGHGRHAGAIGSYRADGMAGIAGHWKEPPRDGTSVALPD